MPTGFLPLIGTKLSGGVSAGSEGLVVTLGGLGLPGGGGLPGPGGASAPGLRWGDLLPPLAAVIPSRGVVGVLPRPDGGAGRGGGSDLGRGGGADLGGARPAGR